MPEYISYLPHINATLNSTSALLLIAGFRFIRLGRIQAHRICQVTAVFTSTPFFVSSLIYYYLHRATTLSRQGLVRSMYFAIITTHTMLSGGVVPLIWGTLY